MSFSEMQDDRGFDANQYAFFGTANDEDGGLGGLEDDGALEGALEVNGPVIDNNTVLFSKQTNTLYVAAFSFSAHYMVF